jgi:hypothetical protein
MIKTSEKHKIDYIDASSVCEFHRCPAKYMFSRLMGLSLPEASSIAPDFGTCIHRALPFCYDGTDKLALAVEEFRSAWRKLPYGETDPKRNSLRAACMLRYFASQHSPSQCPYTIEKYSITAPTQDIISPNEIPFLIDIGGDLPAAGRLDLAVTWRSTGQLWAVDYKTASEISARYFNSFKLSPQVCLYTLAICQISGRRAEGMIIEALRVSQTNDETQSNFIFVSDLELRLMLEHVNGLSARLLQCNVSGEWPQCPSACSSYGMFGSPGGTCPYLYICQSSDWLDATRMYVRRKPFHPFEIETGVE